MKNIYTAVLLICTFVAGAQTFTAKTVAINSNSNGFYEYLPQGYFDSKNKRFPLIVFIHGQDKLGYGGEAMDTLLTDALPKLIHIGKFPGSFIVNNTTYSFIVVAPQFKKWPTEKDIADVLSYAVKTYNVDEERMYLTGVSMGGGVVWDYAGASVGNAKRVAAILPVAGASSPYKAKGENIATANLPVWATHNLNDPIVTSFYTNAWVDLINSYAPAVPAIKNIFFENSHDAWSKTYDPLFKPRGINVYEWMLQYSRTTTLAVTFKGYKAYVTTSNRVAVEWSTTFEKNNKEFIVQRSTDGVSFTNIAYVPATNIEQGTNYSFTDEKPMVGINFYRLVQVDHDNKQTVYGVLKVTVAAIANKLQIAPNPAKNSINLRWNNMATGVVDVVIADMQGKILRRYTFQKTAGELQEHINVNQLKAGAYLLRLSIGNTSVVRQLLKE